MSRRADAMRRELSPATAGVAAPTDRRLHRSDVRPARRQRMGRFAVRTAAAGLVALALVSAGAWSVNRLLHSRLLAVSNIDIHGNVRLSRGEVEALVDGLRGESLMRVDFNRYRRQLMDSPWVADVHLSRVLPSTVDIRIVERVPMAVARYGNQLYLVDDGGVIIDEFGPQYTEFDLPIVDGLVTTPANGRTPVDAQRVSLTARCLADLEARRDLRQRVSQLDVSNARDVVALLTDDPVRLHLGDANFTQRLTTYLQIAPTLRDQLQTIDSVDLRFDNQVFVKSAGKAQAKAVQTKSVAKPAPRKSKHP